MEKAPALAGAFPLFRASLSDPRATLPGMGELTDQDRAILDFERQWWKYAGAKEDAILTLFGMSPSRYYQRLNGLLDDPAALAYDAALVRRLHRIRESRKRARAAGLPR